MTNFSGESTATSPTTRLHAFRTDALGYDDASGIADRIRAGELDPVDALEAAIARIEEVEPTLGALAHRGFDLARDEAERWRRHLHDGDSLPPFAGVPSAFKDNATTAGLPMTQGSDSVPAVPQPADGPVAREMRATGLNPLGATTMPPFGWTAATERQGGLATRNPWSTDRTPGGSSGGSAALVAAGALPIAHANDGGGSIRIPAAATGLVGYKPSRGRHADEAYTKDMPIPIVSQGVVARSVRDVVRFHRAIEAARPPQGVPPLGTVARSPRRRLRIGVIKHSPVSADSDAATVDALRLTADRLAGLGHHVETATAPPIPATFDADFKAYWSLLAFSSAKSGRKRFGAAFDPDRLDPFTAGLAENFRRSIPRIPLHLWRLERLRRRHDRLFGSYDVYLNPVVAHETPEVGHLGADLPFEVHMERVTDWVTFTPLQNVAGTPAISLPAATAPDGMPIGIQVAARRGDDRILLELAREYEDAHPFARIWE